MIDLSKEAEEYAQKVWGTYINDVFKHDDIIIDKTLGEITISDFIAGATDSKYVQAKIIQAQIDVLNKTRAYFDVSKLDVYEQKHHVRFTSIIIDQMEKLQQQLKQLENEYTDSGR